MLIMTQSNVINFLKELLNPEGFGYSVTSEVRKEAKHILDTMQLNKTQELNMSNDFEVHPIGTAEEIRKSRELASEIHQSLDQFGKVIPNNILQAYNRLYGQYIKQKQSEEYL